MKKIVSFVLAVMMLALLMSCAKKQDTPDPAVSSDAASPTDEISPSDNVSAIKSGPLEEGEMFYKYGVELVSIAQLEERFGPASNFSAGYSEGTCSTTVTVYWYQAEMQVVLGYSGTNLSFYEGDGNEDDLYRGYHEVSPTLEDKAIPMGFEYICWSRADLVNPRGIKIGMSLTEVQAAYPESIFIKFDKNADDNSTPLTFEGLDAKLCAFTLPKSQLTSESNSVYPSEYPDYFEFATFYFKGDTLVAMDQGNGGMTFTP